MLLDKFDVPSNPKYFFKGIGDYGMRDLSEVSKYEHKKIMQHYRVTMANHDLSAVEMRIMAMVVLKLKDAQIQGYDKDVKDSSDLFDEFNRVTIKNAEIVVGDNYGEVRKALKSLTKRDIELKKDKGTYFFNLVREAYYSDDKTRIDIDVSPHILPDLIAIGKNYTSYGLEFLFRTKSPHAIRWYQIGSHWLKNGVFYISKNEIRELFKVQGKYPKHAMFNLWLVKKPFEEINKKSDIEISVSKTHKDGRSIIGYTISVKRKGKTIEQQEDKENTHKWLNGFASKYWKGVSSACKKAEYDAVIMREKLKKRGVKQSDYTSERHFHNATIQWVAHILTMEGNQSETKNGYVETISQEELNI